MSDQERPDDVGASTERFEAFVRRGDELERERPGSNTFRVLTLLGGLAVLAVVIVLLVR
jgi:hypothetical protein